MDLPRALSDRVIVVTGGGGLLGRRFCRAVADEGAVAVVGDVDVGGAERVAKDIANTGGRVEAVPLDIANRASVDRLIADLHGRYGRIDAVVNNAYPRRTSWGRKLEDVEYSDFCEHLSLHLGGYFLVAQRFALYFRGHQGGNIVNMASIYGTIPPRFEIYAGTAMTSPVEYAAIKSGVIQLTRYFAQYFKRDGVRCNALSPGGVFDNQPASFVTAYRSCCGAKGMLEPDDLTGALVFLLSDASRYMTGQNVIVDDGFSL